MFPRITPLTDAPSADPAVPSAPGARRLAWLADDEDGNPVGSAFVRLPGAEGRSHLADLDLHVHPAERRRGVGTRLLAAALRAARDEGRRTLAAEARAGSAGEAFLAARGFRTALTLIHVRLALQDVDTAALAAAVARPHAGYRLLSWDGVVPAHLAPTFARSRRAMDDMPMGSVDRATPAWDVERVRAAARAVADRGDLLHTVAAVSTSDGEVVAFTELVVPGDGTGDAQHYGTGVLPRHRGRGLGRWIKSASILDARRGHPRLGGLLTDTADVNPHMRAINEALGYEPTHRMTVCHRKL
ncbi:GNAT family N-acetyltransferase [Streptomyces sp. NRRL F-5126]|uniref:GNAT family N-acetyltransferase n=1 Tax=Streptomyces sp. NRRL F-5126 TaxID=1463857 RepID=UPI0004C5F386